MRQSNIERLRQLLDECIAVDFAHASEMAALVVWLLDEPTLSLHDVRDLLGRCKRALDENAGEPTLFVLYGRLLELVQSDALPAYRAAIALDAPAWFAYCAPRIRQALLRTQDGALAYDLAELRWRIAHDPDGVDEHYCCVLARHRGDPRSEAAIREIGAHLRAMRHTGQLPDVILRRART